MKREKGGKRQKSCDPRTCGITGFVLPPRQQVAALQNKEMNLAISFGSELKFFLSKIKLLLLSRCANKNMDTKSVDRYGNDKIKPFTAKTTTKVTIRKQENAVDKAYKNRDREIDLIVYRNRKAYRIRINRAREK